MAISKRSVVWLLVWLLLSGCSSDVSDGAWDVGERADAEPSINLQYCGELRGHSAQAGFQPTERSAVWQRSVGTFSSGCAVYQVLLELDLSSADKEQWRLRTDYRACNQCEQPASVWRFRPSPGSGIDTQDARAFDLAVQLLPVIMLEDERGRRFPSYCRTPQISRGVAYEGGTIYQYALEPNEAERVTQDYPLHRLFHLPPTQAVPSPDEGYWTDPLDYELELRAELWAAALHAPGSPATVEKAASVEAACWDVDYRTLGPPHDVDLEEAFIVHPLDRLHLPEEASQYLRELQLNSQTDQSN